MNITNLIKDRTKTEIFKEPMCFSLTPGSRQHFLFLSAVNVFISVTAFLGNSLILVALRRASSIHSPSKLLYRCLATTDLCVGLVSQPFSVAYWMSLIYKDWGLCRYANVASYTAGAMLSSVSLLTLSAISVDRLFALSLGLRYRQVVTLKRTYLVVVTFWVVSIVASVLTLVDHRITLWYSYIAIPSCLATSIASYTKIFCTLRHHQNQVQNHAQQQPSLPNALNMARYRKAVYSALSVQLVLVICYLPYNIVVILADNGSRRSSLYVPWLISLTLVYFNSSLNPFLYCWKISEVRQAVKETIRQTLCRPWS